MLSSLVSFSKRPIHEQIPGMIISDYFLEESRNGNPSILLVDDSHYHKPNIDGQNDQVFVPSEQIVRSLVHMHISSQIEYKQDRHPAFFCVPNEVVTPQNLTTKHEGLVKKNLSTQHRWFVALVKIADDDWQRSKSHVAISDIQRTAARELKLKREWLMSVEDENNLGCPFCGSNLLDPMAPICPHCGRTHNPERLAQIESKMIRTNPVTGKPS